MQQFTKQLKLLLHVFSQYFYPFTYSFPSTCLAMFRNLQEVHNHCTCILNYNSAMKGGVMKILYQTIGLFPRSKNVLVFRTLHTIVPACLFTPSHVFQRSSSRRSLCSTDDEEDKETKVVELLSHSVCLSSQCHVHSHHHKRGIYSGSEVASIKL